ncbi:hypothetical protein H5410_045906 [Solanum commersonii]|uniref:MADS-box domain-containing protein n=1 Tax=Solanum commersonii TaxID=4109 RepID=A0A9J5XF05_SOLCO|nr:hypothetical protein H5410_045906 [Solanum commersonii]
MSQISIKKITSIGQERKKVNTRLVAIKLQLDKINKVKKSVVQVELLNFDLHLIESDKAHIVSFSKRKKTLFMMHSTKIGMDVCFILFSPSGELCPYDSTCIEKIIDKFFKVKPKDHQCEHVEGKSNIFEEFKDLHK